MAVAYRVLGRVCDAEDVVQEAWLRLLTTGDVADDAALADSVSLAMLVVLETLSPLERAAFVLREVFSFSYSDIAEIIGRSEAAVRQLASRAREHVAGNRPRLDADRVTRRCVTEQFLAACASGNMQALLELLAPEVMLVADGGGWAKAPLRVTAPRPPAVRYVIGGWTSVIARLAARARELGVVIETGARVDQLPAPPVIVATELTAAQRLLADATLRWDSGRSVLLDVGVTARRAMHSRWSTSTRLASSSATARPTPPWRRPGTLWCKRKCRCVPESRRPTGCSGWNDWSSSGYPAGAGVPPGAATRSPPGAPVRWTYPAEPGVTGRRSTAATGCSSPGTWSPPPACSVRSPSTAPSRRRAAQCTPPAFARTARRGACRPPGRSPARRFTR
ncbi:MAG: hypothetical protein H0V41_08015 [Pseudonocardiales bacterium]|nr:hypothetical protein [Pseudonocardiales bacterium]